MAFVQQASTSLRVSTFTRPAIETKPRLTSVKLASNVRMATEGKEGDEPSAVGIAGKSKWKENLFAGGFPGGEGFFKQWIDNGMKDDVPDMPRSMQPSTEFKPKKPAEKTGVLAKLDKTEFFKDYVGSGTETDDEETEEGEEPVLNPERSAVDFVTAMVSGAGINEIIPSDILETEVPDEKLYSKYFPAARRSIAPFIDIDYMGSPYDRVGVSMNPVNASYTDVYYPKETKNKAPMISIFYAGSENTASIRLSLDLVDPLPTLPPPPRAGDTILSLLPGSGGGLKLNFETTDGEKITL